MKKVLTIMLVLLFLVSPCYSFLYQIEILDEKAIEKLTDEELIDAYIEVVIELRTANSFHNRAGFSNPNEYRKHKEVFRYSIYLIKEIEKRKLKVPSIDAPKYEEEKEEKDESIKVK